MDASAIITLVIVFIIWLSIRRNDSGEIKKNNQDLERDRIHRQQ